MSDLDVFDISNPPVLSSDGGAYTISREHLIAADREEIDVVEDLILRNENYIFEVVKHFQTGGVTIKWRKRDSGTDEESPQQALRP